VRKEE